MGLVSRSIKVGVAIANLCSCDVECRNMRSVSQEIYDTIKPQEENGDVKRRHSLLGVYVLMHLTAGIKKSEALLHSFLFYSSSMPKI
jgi:hypothetical protein